MAVSESHRQRVNLYIRLTLAASLLGIGYGFYRFIFYPGGDWT